MQVRDPSHKFQPFFVPAQIGETGSSGAVPDAPQEAAEEAFLFSLEFCCGPAYQLFEFLCGFLIII